MELICDLEPPEAAWFAYQGATVHYRRCGKGRPIIFLHNGGSSHLIWDRQLDRFQGGFDCIAPDLPGYGQSADPSRRYTLRFYIDFVAALIHELELTAPIIVGNCIGSAIALGYATENPDQVDRLVLFNALTRATVRSGWLGPIFSATNWTPKVRPHLRKALSYLRLPSFAGAQMVQAQFATQRAEDRDLKKSLTSFYAQKGQSGALADILVDIDTYAGFDSLRLPKNFPPVMMIWGQQNRILSWKAGRTLARSLGVARQIIIPDAGHLPMIEASTTVNDILAGFINSPTAQTLER